MDNPTRTPDDMFSARRRLLRGSFSAPAVLTLASGSALAAQSATCLAKATATPTTAALATSANADTFMRIRLLARPNGVHLLTRASLGRIPVNLSFWNTGTLWQRVGVSGVNLNKAYGAQETGSVPNNAAASNYWVALRFNNAGEIVGVGASGSGSVVGQSCWNSIRTSP